MSVERAKRRARQPGLRFGRRADGEAALLRGRPLFLARLAWAALVALTLAVYAVAMPVDFAELARPHDPPLLWTYLAPAQMEALAGWGLSPGLYAAYVTLLQLVVVACFVLLGLLIFWRRSDEAMAIFTSGVTIVFGATAAATTLSLVGARPEWHLPVDILNAIGLGSAVLFFYLFPDGRFVPGWTKWPAALWLAWMAFWPFYPAASPNNLPEPLPWIAKFIPFATGVAAQVYRYRYYASPAERQQTKWVVWGLAAALGGFFVYNLAMLVVPPLQRHGQERLLYILVGYPLLNLLPLLMAPLSLGFASLRYRLWDVDDIIRSTLVYGAVTALVGLAYYGSVVALQQVFRVLTGQSSALAIAASTLAVALLFSPLRGRVHDLVDRRFYRRKYDSEQVLARFGAIVRDEVDLERLTGKLLGVVHETMQPTLSSLWLRDEPPPLSAENRQPVARGLVPRATKDEA